VLSLLVIVALAAVTFPTAAQAGAVTGTLTRGPGDELTYKLSDSAEALNRFQLQLSNTLQFSTHLTDATCPAGWQLTTAFLSNAFTCDGGTTAQIGAGQSVTVTATTGSCVPAGFAVQGMATNTHASGVPPQENFTLTAPAGSCSTGGIRGTVLDKQGNSLPGVMMTVTGTDATTGSSVNHSIATDQKGDYAFALNEGTYTVAASGDPPGQPPKLEYLASPCPGTDNHKGSCQGISLQAGQTVDAGFVYGCGVNGVRLDSVEPLTDQPLGAAPGSLVMLKGRGFCTGMTVEFGNRLARADVPDAQITSDGSSDSATATVPRLATTGPVMVDSAGQQATLDDVAIDSFRDVNGFRFPNQAGVANYDEFAHVFGFAKTFVTTKVDVCATQGCTITDLTPTPAAKMFFDTQAKGWARGLCFGLVLASQRLSSLGDVPLGSLGQQARDVWELQSSPAVLQFVRQQHWVQVSDQVESLYRQFKARHDGAGGTSLLNEVQADLGVGLDGGGNGVIVAMWGRGKNGEMHAHAVLAYNVETDQSSPGTGFIDVYDPNTPYTNAQNGIGTDEEGHLGLSHQERTDASRIEVGSDGSWSFAPLRMGGPAQQIAFIPFDLITREIDHGLTFGNSGTADITLSDATTLGSLTAPSGQAVNLSGPGNGGVQFGTITDGSGGDSSFLGAPGAYHEVLSGASTIDESWAAAGRQGRVELSRGTDAVAFDTAKGTLSVAPAAGHGHASAHETLTLAAGLGRAAHEVTVSGPEHGGVALALGAGAPRLSVNSAGTYAVTLVAGRTTLAGTARLRAGDAAELIARGNTLNARVRHRGGASKTVSIGHQLTPKGATVIHLAVAGRAVRATLATPSLPVGSTVKLFVAFVNGRKLIHIARVAVSIAHGSRWRAVRVRFPARLHGRVTITATAITAIATTVPASSVSQRTARA
jgi:hypothetical protein